MNAKKLKRFLSVVLSLSMVLSVNTVNFASEVTGIANPDAHVHEDAAGGHVHEWVLQETVTPATCLEDGVGVYACEGCEGTEEDAIPATKHSYEAEDFDKDLPENYEIVKEASCTEAGVKAYTCANEGCTEETGGHVEEEEIPAAGHTWENGECTVCHESQNVRELGDASNEELKSSGHQQADAPYEAPVVDFTDKEPAEQAEEPVKAPSMSNEVKQPEMFAAGDAGDSGNEGGTPSTHTQADCDAGNHDYSAAPVIYQSATCTEEGLGKYTCGVCKKSAFRQIPPAHKYQKLKVNLEPEYDKDGNIVITDGTEGFTTNVIVPAGCVITGLTRYVCGSCSSGTQGKIYNKIMGAIGHKYTTTTATGNCPAQGIITTQTCNVCLDGTEGKVVETVEPGTGQHVFDQEESISEDCENPTRKLMKCACGEEDPAGIQIVPVADGGKLRTGHDYEAVDEDGNVKDPVDGKRQIKADATASDEKAAKCNEEGYKEYTCSKCADAEGIKDRVYKVVIPKTDHVLITEIIPATCEANGVVNTVCNICKEIIESEDAVAHFGQEVAEEKGLVKKADHSWKIVGNALNQPATCTKAGAGMFECEYCHRTELREIQPHHAYQNENGEIDQTYLDDEQNKDKYVFIDVQPTCEGKGHAVLVCKECGVSFETELEALGHDYKGDTNPKEEQEYPCQPGKKIYACQREGCDEESPTHFLTEEMPIQANHTWTEEDKPATCKEPAMKGEHCSVCGEAKEGATLVPSGKRKGHTYEKKVDGVVQEPINGKVQLADGLEAGADKDYTDSTGGNCKNPGTRTYKCRDCGETYEVPLEANPGHTHVPSVKPATCQGNAKLIETCTECGNLVISEEDAVEVYGEELAGKLGLVQEDHKWAEDTAFALKKNATCTEAGLKRYTCSNTVDGKPCDATKTISIPAHHAYMDDEGNLIEDYGLNDGADVDGERITIKAATCTENGRVRYICNVSGCTGEGKTYEVDTDALGHDFDYENGADSWPDGDCQPGVTTYTCKRTCGGVKCAETTTTPLPSNVAHKYMDSSLPATCDKAAQIGTKFCEICKAPKEPDKVKDDPENGPTGHDYETKNEDGTIGVKHDEDGNIVLPDDFDSKGGTIDDTKTVEPSCTKTGTTVYVCHCKVTYEDTVPMVAHNYTKTELLPADCQNPARIAQYCSYEMDEEGYVPNYIVVNGSAVNPEAHDWKLVGEPTKAATCTEDGEGNFKCSLCGKEEVRAIPAGHTWGEEETVTVGGTDYTIHTCTGECKKTELVNKVEGKTYCNVCKTVTSTAVLAGFAATCGKEGLADGLECATCRTAIKGQEPIPALTHIYVWKPVQPAPSYTCGPKKEIMTCVNCSATTGEPRVKEEGDGKHNWKEEIVAPEKCGEQSFIRRTCQDCGEVDSKVDVIAGSPVKEHNFVNHECTYGCGTKEVDIEISADAYVDGSMNLVMFTSTRSVANKNVTVLGQGILYSTKKDYDPNKEMTLVDVDNLIVRQAELSDITKTGYAKRISVGTEKDRILYARGYVTVQYEDGSIGTLYSDMEMGSYNSISGRQ